MANFVWKKSKSLQKYFGFGIGSVLFVHPVLLINISFSTCFEALMVGYFQKEKHARPFHCINNTLLEEKNGFEKKPFIIWRGSTQIKFEIFLRKWYLLDMPVDPKTRFLKFTIYLNIFLERIFLFPWEVLVVVAENSHSVHIQVKECSRISWLILQLLKWRAYNSLLSKRLYKPTTLTIFKSNHNPLYTLYTV